MSRPWFVQKRYGLGVAPASPAGWIALSLFVAAMVATGPLVRSLHLPVWFIWISLAVEIAIMLWVVVAKGDGRPWRWRRGD